MDKRTCNKCRNLDGRTWTIVGYALPHIVSHPTYGDVYDVKNDEPLIHGYGPWRCRCTLLVEIDDSDVLAAFEELETQTSDLAEALTASVDYIVNFIGIMRLT